MPGEAGRGGRARSAGKRSSAGKPLPRGMLGSVVRPAGPRRAASPPLPAAGPDASWAGPGASLPAPPPRSGGRWTCCGGGWAPREEGLPPPSPPKAGEPLRAGFSPQSAGRASQALAPGSRTPALRRPGAAVAGRAPPQHRQAEPLQPADTAEPAAEPRAGVRQHGARPTMPTARPPALSLKSWYSSA